MSLESIKTIKKILLEDLIEIYERRALKNSNFTTRVFINIDNKSYPKYFENEKLFNSSLKELNKEGFINLEFVKFTSNYSRFILNISKIDEIYLYLDKNNPVIKFKELLHYFDEYPSDINNKKKQEIIEAFKNNKSISTYLKEDFKDLIKLSFYLENNESEIYERNFSNKIFNNSKRLETLKSQINTYYGLEDVLLEKGVIKNPTYLFLKGSGTVILNNQHLDLDKLGYPIGISSKSIKDLEFKNIQKVTTIENLTTFNDYNDYGLILYLGGFSNRDKIKLLKKLKKVTNNFNHFGDIDYGGFLILSNLISNLGLDIKTVNMSIFDLEKYYKYWIPITDKEYLDKLASLLKVDNLKEHYDTIKYLIDNKIKLEQESISLI